MDMRALLEMMVGREASDLFITAGMPPSLKIDGRIAPVNGEALSAEQARRMVHSVMTEAQRGEFEHSYECNFAISEPGLGRFRVSAFYQRSHVGMVLRRIQTDIPSIDSLHLPSILRSRPSGKPPRMTGTPVRRVTTALSKVTPSRCTITVSRSWVPRQ
ncbi:MAG: hypothetical protein R6W98_10760, partial [Oceanibaculum nanhaiense]